MRPPLIRLAAGLVAVALTAVGLTGCAGGSGTGGCTPQTTSGSASESVRARGAFGTAPTVTFARPLHTDTTESTALTTGSGAPIQAAQQVVLDVTLLEGTTGATVLSSFTGSSPGPTSAVVRNIAVPGLRKALTCSRVGERLAVVIPPQQGIPAANRPAGVTATDTLVAVVDVRRAYLARADGVDQVMAGGLPAVVLGADGRPGITLPQADPPKTLRVADLKKGSGAVIRAGDTAVVQYTGVLWLAGQVGQPTVFQTTWNTDQPQSLIVRKGQIVDGLVTALAGQRVGSQVLAVVPPGQGYGAQATETVPANSTLVFVIDVLGKA